MIEPDLEAVLAAARPHRLLELIPDELRPWLLPIDWDRDRLWSVEQRVAVRAIRDLDWHYHLPWWKSDDAPAMLASDGAGWFTVRPAEVTAEPDLHRYHCDKIETVDLSFPIHVLWRQDRWVILDGIHRLVRADREGLRSMSAVPLSAADVAMIAGVDGLVAN